MNAIFKRMSILTAALLGSLLVFFVSSVSFAENIVQVPEVSSVSVGAESHDGNWFTKPLYGMLASIEDPFGTDADSIKPDAAQDGDLRTSFINIINYLLAFLGLVLLVIIIYAGVLIIMSDGEEDAITKGRKMIMYALIGVAIIVLSYTIVNFITDVAQSGQGN